MLYDPELLTLTSTLNPFDRNTYVNFEFGIGDIKISLIMFLDDY